MPSRLLLPQTPNSRGGNAEGQLHQPITSGAQPSEQVPPQRLASDPPGAMDSEEEPCTLSSEEEPCTLSSLPVELLMLVAKNLLIPALAPVRLWAQSLAFFAAASKVCLAVANKAAGRTPAHFAAARGDEACLRVLHELVGNAAASLATAEADGYTPAHLAANRGHEGCLRVLHELGGDAAASLAAARSADGITPAHLAATIGYEGCLRVLHELGGDAAASLAAANAKGDTPVRFAAAIGYEGCLRVLHELGGDAAASLAAANAKGDTPVRFAAAIAWPSGREGCLRVLHMALRKYLLTRVRGIAHVHIFLARWSADALAAAYAPGGVGHARARASFETSRVALQQKT